MFVTERVEFFFFKALTCVSEVDMTLFCKACDFIGELHLDDVKRLSFTSSRIDTLSFSAYYRHLLIRRIDSGETVILSDII